MSDIQVFNNEQFGSIRTAGTADNPTFCLTDVCKILALDSSQVMKRLGDGVVSIHPIQDSLGRTQQANFVNEDAVSRFLQIVEAMGVVKALREQGCQDGDTVRIKDVEFDFVD